MSSSSSKWASGCGIGCGVVIFLLAVIILGGYFLVKNTVKDFRSTGDSIDALVEKYGESNTYCPHPSGIIAAERIEAFISVRDSIASLGETIGESLQSISETMVAPGGQALRIGPHNRTIAIWQIEGRFSPAAVRMVALVFLSTDCSPSTVLLRCALQQVHKSCDGTDTDNDVKNRLTQPPRPSTIGPLL